MTYSSVKILFVSHIILPGGAQNLYLSVLEEDPIHTNVNRSDLSPSSRSGNHFTHIRGTWTIVALFKDRD